MIKFLGMNRFFIIWLGLLSLNSCVREDKNNLFKEVLKPTSLNVKEVLNLNLNRIEDDVPLFEYKYGDTNIVLELTKDEKYIYAQRWYFPLFQKNDSANFYQFLEKQNVILYNYYLPFDSLKNDSPNYFAYSNKYNTVYRIKYEYDMSTKNRMLFFEYLFPLYVHQQRVP